MTMPYYVAPEQAMKDKADFARKGIARGRSAVVLTFDDGVLLFKYWLTVDQAQQEERFAERLEDPMKRWKLSPIDLKAREKYAAYTKAREAMLGATHTKSAPWTLVDFNDQRVGRLKLIRHLLDHLPDTKVAEEKIVFPPLPGKPLKESFKSQLKPI